MKTNTNYTCPVCGLLNKHKLPCRQKKAMNPCRRVVYPPEDRRYRRGRWRNECERIRSELALLESFGVDSTEEGSAAIFDEIRRNEMLTKDQILTDIANRMADAAQEHACPSDKYCIIVNAHNAIDCRKRDFVRTSDSVLFVLDHSDLGEGMTSYKWEQVTRLVCGEMARRGLYQAQGAKYDIKKQMELV